MSRSVAFVTTLNQIDLFVRRFISIPGRWGDGAFRQLQQIVTQMSASGVTSLASLFSHIVGEEFPVFFLNWKKCSDLRLLKRSSIPGVYSPDYRLGFEKYKPSDHRAATVELTLCEHFQSVISVNNRVLKALNEGGMSARWGWRARGSKEPQPF